MARRAAGRRPVDLDATGSAVEDAAGGARLIQEVAVAIERFADHGRLPGSGDAAGHADLPPDLPAAAAGGRAADIEEALADALAQADGQAHRLVLGVAAVSAVTGQFERGAVISGAARVRRVAAGRERVGA